MVLDWGKITANNDSFNDIVDNLPILRDSWSNQGDGYPSGSRPGANIDPHQLSAPGDDPSRAPR